MCSGSVGDHHIPEKEKKNTRNCGYDSFTGEQQQLLAQILTK